MRRLFVLLIVLGLSLMVWQPARAQSVSISDVQVMYIFGEQITFSARITSSAPIKETILLFRAEGEENTRVNNVEMNEAGEAILRFDVPPGTLRPFARIIFWYRIILQDGQVYDSAQYFFEYTDNRFPWQVLEDAAVRLHWYSGELSFGQAAFDVARVGLQNIASLIPLSLTEPLDIYIYTSAADLQSALNLGGQTWVAGHASPDLGVAMVSIAPGAEQSLGMEGQIPHELAHVLLYQITGNAYGNLPVWLREGIASLAELYPNPDYPRALTLATQNVTLLPLTDLCAAFPPDASRAFLAYAESASFTRFLHDNFGTSGLHALIIAYADGLDCEQGATRALGTSLTQLDTRWREAVLGANPVGIASRNLLPYLLLLGVILIGPIWGIAAFIRARKKDAG